jgi:apolipoprotein D and lipocalin family protein
MKTLLCTTWVLAACATTTERLGLPELKTEERVELPRYLGTWFEIASFPQRFQKGCTATTATYTLRDDGDIDVVNRCRLHALDGPEKVARGHAVVTEPSTNAKLKVTFFKPFWGEYWIVEVGPEYEYAVVGHPGRDYLWILSRSSTMDPATYAGIVERLRAQGYETARLQKTLQPQNVVADLQRFSGREPR